MAGKFAFKSDNAIKQTIEKQISRYESENIKVASLKHVPCTLYAVELTKSSSMIASGDVRQIVGPESPVKFKKIRNFRILIDSELFGPDTKEEWGFETDTQLSVLFMPGLIEPETESILVFDHMSNLGFKVINSNMTKVLNTTYVQANIVVEITKSDPYWIYLDKQVVSTYELTKYRDGMFIMSDDNINKYNKLNKVLTNSLIEYNSKFFKKELNSYILKKNNELIYDPYLYSFIINNKVMADLDFKDYTIPSKEILFELDYDRLYHKSLFHKIENKPDIEFMNTNLPPFKQANLEYYIFDLPRDVYIWSRFDNAGADYSIKIVSRSESENNSVISYKGVNTETVSELDTIINNYIFEKLNITDLFALYNYEINDTYEDYIKFPICIYILKNYMSNIKSVDINNDLLNGG